LLFVVGVLLHAVVMLGHSRLIVLGLLARGLLVDGRKVDCHVFLDAVLCSRGPRPLRHVANINSVRFVFVE
jgi:hypothetical protein